ncbi:MAG: hypothetical protein QW521_03635 [Desulfurococcaceae archaeon]
MSEKYYIFDEYSEEGRIGDLTAVKNEIISYMKEIINKEIRKILESMSNIPDNEDINYFNVKLILNLSKDIDRLLSMLLDIKVVEEMSKYWDIIEYVRKSGMLPVTYAYHLLDEIEDIDKSKLDECVWIRIHPEAQLGSIICRIEE